MNDEVNKSTMTRSEKLVAVGFLVGATIITGATVFFVKRSYAASKASALQTEAMVRELMELGLETANKNSAAKKAVSAALEKTPKAVAAVAA